MTTMRDVAERAQVSIATVSRVINGTDFVSPELVARVTAAMQEVGYRPNRAARSLRTQQTHLLSLVISDISNTFFASIVRGAEDAANEHGYTVIISNTDEDATKESESLSVLSERRPDGYVIAPTGIMEAGMENLIGSGSPFVFVDRLIEDIPAHAVLSENHSGGFIATSHLIKLGHRRIGVILGRPHLTPSKERLEGFLEALRQHGLEADQSLIARGYFEIAGGRQACHQLLQLPDPPTALVSVGSAMALGAIQAMASLGIGCPEDVSLVCFNDFPWMDHFHPPLTTIAQEPYDMGYQAVELLVETIRGERERTPPTVKRMPCSLNVRGSTAPPPVEHRGETPP